MKPMRFIPPPLALMALGLLAAACSSEAPSPDITTGASPPPPPRLAPTREAVEQADVMKMHPESMERAAVERALGGGAGCTFAYTEAGRPVLVVRAPGGAGAPATAVVKLHGKLTELRTAQPVAAEQLRDGADLGAEGLAIRVRPVPGEEAGERGQREADLELQLAEGLSRAWRGVYRCSG